MGTSSMIGYVQEDGSVITTYCHFDGYVDGVGRELAESFSTPEKAKSVASIGYLSGLQADLELAIDDAVHTEDPVVYASSDVFLKCGDNHAGAEYLYLFDNLSWSVSTTEKRKNDRTWAWF
jgi:hypothetical protein